MGRNRLEDASCAICMDSLFTKRDDLDELIPIATSDCGHVFHEPCVMEWFKTQSEHYLATARDQGINGRYGSPSLSDAPAECPSCRTECFADPETGQPTIHRLYLNFENTTYSSSMLGSSPVSSSRRLEKGKGKEKEKEGGKDKEVIGLARRAKNVTEEVKGLSADSQDDEVEGMIRRGEALSQDLVSQKALNAVQNHITNLTNELAKLRMTLQTNPLIPSLRARVAERELELTNLHRQMRLDLSRETKKIKDDEQAKCERRVKRAQDERDLFQREYDKEKVARKTGMRAMEERNLEYKRILDETTELLKQETKSRKDLQDVLLERGKHLKILQKRAEDRRVLKAQVVKLEAENARLKSIQHRASSTKRPSSPDIDCDQQEYNEGDKSIQEVSRSHFPTQSGTGASRRSKHEDEDSLQIEMPSYHDDSSVRSLSRLLPSRKTMKQLQSSDDHLSEGRITRMHPTARTIQFDLTDNITKDRKRSTSSKYFPSGASDHEGETENRTSGSGSSFEDREEVDGSGVIVHATPSPIKERERIPSPYKRSKTNPFMTTKASSERRKELPLLAKLSEPLKSSREPPPNKGWNDRSIIDLASSSPPSSPNRPPMQIKKRVNMNLGERLKERSVVDMLGLRDANGRPKKGVVSGQKIKRKV
ncbi:uncharacterized protein IL334_006070 [Kwoniella shivajii]|uniref:RING-type domain-containing protein n=1 Tax=Kwoniella shivajii TaxID=564305 RepID=A0ABZ1D8W4_9TREE|nr:hypothetical protein IL334_006070 [Kwoniella shivajii]